KEPNGKEMRNAARPHASFNKYTSHTILKDLKINHPEVLPYFKVDDPERSHRIWQRDPLAVLMDSREKVEQKIHYMHTNPLHERWNLADSPLHYRWSSAQFYETGVDELGFLTHYMERF
ncbi:MAG: transposase, partial [Bacteroidetes bacterium]|nr:transposase [Bacteroidota bacterium]